MNAQHPFRALHGHLAVVPDAPCLDALAPLDSPRLNDREFARGQFQAGPMTERALDAVTEGTRLLLRAAQAGAGSTTDLAGLDRIAERLRVALRETEEAAGLLYQRHGARF